MDGKCSKSTNEIWNYSYGSAEIMGIVLANDYEQATDKAMAYIAWVLQKTDSSDKADPAELLVWNIDRDYTYPEHPDIYDRYGTV